MGFRDLRRGFEGLGFRVFRFGACCLGLGFGFRVAGQSRSLWVLGAVMYFNPLS